MTIILEVCVCVCMYVQYVYELAQLPFILSLKCMLNEPETTVKIPQLYIHTVTVMDAMKSVHKSEDSGVSFRTIK